MYKLNHNNKLPEVFNPLFKFNMVHSISTRNKNAYHYPFYCKSSTQQSIEYSGVKVWNALPNDIKSLQSKSVFSSESVVLKVVDIDPQGSIGPSKGSKIAKGSNGGQ